LDSGAHPHEAHALKLDASKAAADLDWRPVLSLKQSLEWIAEWYQAFRESADLRQFTLKQIEEYERLTQN
jgi:CDP-glucose 4,6-dehydratase